MSSPDRKPQTSRWWLPKSLRARLAWALCGGLSLLLALLFSVLDNLLDGPIYTHLDAGLSQRAGVLAANLDSRSTLAAPASGDMVALWRVDGDRLLPLDAAQLSTVPPLPVPGGSRLFEIELPNDHDARAIALRPRFDDGDGLVLVVAEDRAAAEALENAAHLALAVSIVIAAITALLFALLAVRQALTPLREFADRATDNEVLRGGSLLSVQRMPTELQPFAVAMNRAMDRERRFSRDVAHELRTPLAEIRTAVETASPDRVDVLLGQHIVASVERMQRCVDALAMLSRYEAGIARPISEPLDLAAILRHTVERAKPLLEAKELRLTLSTAGECWLRSDPALLERIVDNLVGNAASYADAASEIDIAIVTDADARPGLRISNAASELSASDLAHFGERFWRKSTARHESDHGGLGLALSMTLAQVLGTHLCFALADGRLTALLGPFAALGTHPHQQS